MSNSSDVRSIRDFLFLLVVFAVCGYFLALASGGVHHFSGILMVQFAPMAAALVSSLIHSRSLRGFGWGWGQWRYQGVAIVLPFFLGLTSFVLVWTFGFGTLDPSSLIKEAQTGLSESFGISLTSDMATLVVLVLINGTVGLIFAFGAIGEELGWRGFLAPKLMMMSNFTTASIVVGSIWGVYHFPLLIWILAPALDVQAWPLLLSALIGAIGLTFIMNWLRFRSGSVWVAVIFHASLNIHNQGYFEAMTVKSSEYTHYLSGEYGFVAAGIFIAVGIVFWRKRVEL